jgi:hypothetical protein
MRNDALGERLWDVSAALVGDYMDTIERPDRDEPGNRLRRPGATS